MQNRSRSGDDNGFGSGGTGGRSQGGGKNGFVLGVYAQRSSWLGEIALEEEVFMSAEKEELCCKERYLWETIAQNYTAEETRQHGRLFSSSSGKRVSLVVLMTLLLFLLYLFGMEDGVLDP